MTSMPLCEHCLTGYVLPDKPTGSMETTSTGISYYLASPENDKEKDNKLLILFTDIFGVAFNNNKILADKMAAQGYKVYVPDILQNDAIPSEHLPPSTGTMLNKLYFMGKLITLLPWIIRHRSAVTLPIVKTFTDEVKALNPGYKVGVTGYCFGGLYSATLAADPSLVDVGFACHPSALNDTVLHNINVPFGFACAAKDDFFSPDYAAKAQEYLINKKIPTEMVVYPGTEHGFAARPDFGNEQTRTAFYAAIQQTVDFLHKYL